MKVLAATRVFGSEVRIRLIRHFIDHPGSQADAARALGLGVGTVKLNVNILVKHGVVVAAPSSDRRTSNYRVDLKRYDELLDALKTFAHKPAKE